MRAFFLASTVLLLASFATANPLFDEFQELEEDDNSPRIFSNNGLGLNQTLDARALLAAALLGLLFAIVLGYSFFGEEETSGYGYGYQKQGYANQNGYANNNQFYARSDKNFYVNDLATQMAQLADAFKKYEVADLDCQLYVACEASQEARHEENGALAREVFDVMRRMKKRGRKAVAAKDEYVARLLDGFVYGEAEQAVQKDACAKMRSKCYEATKKPASQTYN